jgi:hypothetical protein
MAIGDIKTYDINYPGLSLTIQAIDVGDGTVRFVVTCNSGSADVNAIYYNDGVNDGSSFNVGGSLNMNGSGVDWDGATVLSQPGLGPSGWDKPTALTAGESYEWTGPLAGGVTFSNLDDLGVRATSTSTAGGSIKGVDGTGVLTEAPKASIGDASVCEGEDDKATIRITLEKAYTYDVYVSYSTSDGTATNGSDYTGTSGTLKIAAGQTEATFDVVILDDDTQEPAETINVSITSVRLDIPGSDLVSSTDFTADGNGEIQICDEEGGGGGGGDDFPTWPQDISNVVLYFAGSAGNDVKPDVESGPDGDGFYLVKIDNWPGAAADDDLDNSIGTILDYLGIDDSLLLGAAIKGGTQTTQFYAYGDNNTNGDAADVIPTGAPDFETPPAQGQVPGPEIDASMNYGDIFTV